jgi:flagellar protein FliT
MNTPTDLFQRLYTLSVRMVEAARAHDWETLSILEADVAQLHRDVPTHQQMELNHLGIKAALIQKILENDAQIRRHTEPWMEDMRTYLGDAPKRLRDRRICQSPLSQTKPPNGSPP